MRTVPAAHGTLPRSKELLTKAFDDRFQARVKANAQAASAGEPTREALRAAFSAVPGVKEALGKKRARAQALELPRVGKVPAPKRPMVRLGSVQVIDVPPFQALTGQSGTGNNEINLSADPSGNMSFTIAPGLDDSGSCQGWCAIGQAFVTPDAGILEFQATPSFSWSCVWLSEWWRQAAGTVFIGQVINRWQIDGPYIDTPWSSQSNLFSFDDYNLADDGFQQGESSGYDLTATIQCDTSVFLECWVWIGAYSNADGSNGQSSALNIMQANVSSLTLNYWDW